MPRLADGCPIRVLELRSVRGTGGGPEKTILAGAERADPGRFAITVCYLRDRRDPVFRIGERARAVEYVEILERHSFDPRIWTALRRLVRERGFHVVHSHEYKTDLLAYLLARFENLPPVATVHGWTGNSRREQVYYAFDRRLLPSFPRLIAVSSEIRDVLVRCGADASRVHVILNGIDSELFRRDPSRELPARAALGIPPGVPVVGAVGRLERQKRFDVLLEAFSILRREHPSAILVIAGTGTLGADLRATAAALGVSPSVRFLGQIEDVIELHHAIDLYVQSSDYEGTPNALLEAMALETPIVATTAGGTEDLVRDGEHAVLVPPGRADELAGAMGRALADPQSTRRRVVACRRRTETELSFEARMR
ncbi:MAG: glycosyltransferase, partial [Candidatus Binatia bacterium]